MIADPLAVLEEDEIHLAFSSDFTDTKSQFSATMLHGIDVLVAREPAYLPSDIQRVGSCGLMRDVEWLRMNRSKLFSSRS